MSRRLELSLSVNCQEDRDLVGELVREETEKAVGEVPHLLPEPAPAVEFGPSQGPGLELTVSCGLASGLHEYQSRQELRRRILRRFRSEGIAMPYAAPGAAEH